ncbi:hypothetical protein D3Z51_00090 [Clostridiaceae bacterium]|nr:hypothetical protein [Clostridiaceae bacterium]RKI16551.1 hypothetical protein D7V81_04825 [bacterium 1XD21-70]
MIIFFIWDILVLRRNFADSHLVILESLRQIPAGGVLRCPANGDAKLTKSNIPANSGKGKERFYVGK